MRVLRWLFVLSLAIGGCDRAATTQPSGGREVTVYCSVDREFAEPILAEFERRNGITVHRIYDTEAGKTTGLLNRLIAEKARPRADVWWSSEIFGTIQLAEQGMFVEYRPSSAADIPDQYKDPAGRWTAFGLRGRVLAYNPEWSKPDVLPKRWVDLASKTPICIADPRFGTTRGHMAAMLQLWGQEDFRGFLKCLRQNHCKLVDGNSQSVLLLNRKMVDFAATDTDDVIAAKNRGESVEMIYPDLSPFRSDPSDDQRDMCKEWFFNEVITPDQRDPIPGTLWIPCTVALVSNGPNAEQDKSVANYLVSAEVEEKLAQSESRNVPVRPALREKLKIADPRAAKVDYTAIAKKLDESDQLIRDILLK